MHYGEIKKYDIANGEGVRVSLFVSGCTHDKISYNLSVKYLSDQMSRDRLLKNSWSYPFGDLTKGVPDGLAVTRRDELTVVDVGLAELENRWVGKIQSFFS